MVKYIGTIIDEKIFFREKFLEKIKLPIDIKMVKIRSNY